MLVPCFHFNELTVSGIARLGRDRAGIAVSESIIDDDVLKMMRFGKSNGR